jgi:Holliday junction resolvase RusA-like endonuclease
VINSKIMSDTSTKTVRMFVAAAAVLLGAIMMANPISVANAQGNQTNATGVVTITKIDVDPIIKALQDAYPKVEFGEDDQKFVEGLKDIKDAKEMARLIVAEELIHDLMALKALQE